jgi:hypothetical protein
VRSKALYAETEQLRRGAKRQAAIVFARDTHRQPETSWRKPGCGKQGYGQNRDVDPNQYIETTHRVDDLAMTVDLDTRIGYISPALASSGSW